MSDQERQENKLRGSTAYYEITVQISRCSLHNSTLKQLAKARKFKRCFSMQVDLTTSRTKKMGAGVDQLDSRLQSHLNYSSLLENNHREVLTNS